MGKKPKFDPSQNYETVGTETDVQAVEDQQPAKPKFDSAKPFTPVAETVKKKEITQEDQEHGGNVSTTPGAQPNALSVKSTEGPTLEKKNDLINKFFEHEYQDWAEKRTQELKEVIRHDPSKRDQIVAQAEKESTDKLNEFNETIGKFAKINQERFAKEHTGFLGTLKGAFEEVTGAAAEPATEAQLKKLDPIQTAFKRGNIQGKLAEIVSPYSTAKPDKEKLQEIAQLQKEMQELPASEAYTKFNQSKGVGEALSTLAKNPVQIIGELTVESMTSLLNYGATRMAAGAGIGAALGSVVPGIGTAAGLGSGVIAGLSDTSLALEYSGSFMESLQKAGVDVTDPEQLKKAFENDDIISEARSHALKKGIPIAIFDLISGGVAGKITEQPAKSLLKKIGAGAAEFGIQAALGGAGEAAGEAMSGEQLSSSAIIAEMIGELGTTPIEVSANLLGKVKPKPESTVTAPTGDLGKKSEVKEFTILGNEEKAPAEKQKVFVYGTLKDAETRKKALGEDVPTTEAETTGKVEDAGNGFTTLQPGEEKVSGQVMDLTPEQISKLDTYEEKYQREEITLDNGDKAFVYKLKPQENAIRESSAGGVLQHPQEGTGEKGSERGGVEQSVQGEETTKKESPDQQSQVVQPAVEGGVKQTKLGKRFEVSEEPTEIKERVKKDDEYIQRRIDLTDQEAKDLLNRWNDNEHAERVIRDPSFKLNPGVRATLAANLYQNYKSQAESATEKTAKTQFNEKAADIGIWAAQNLTKAGQETAIAGKIWKSILQDEDTAVIALEKENQNVAKKLIAPIQEKVTQSREQFDEEIRKVIAQRVTESVEARLEKAKLITKEKKKEISDFFDSLKVADVKPGELNDITRVVGTKVWNGSMEAVKRAVLTGADVANAIQAGVDYIRANHKGEDFNEQAYRTQITPLVEGAIPKEKIEASSVDASKIETPGITGKKKKDFINSVVEAHNEGTLTDEKFEELYAKKIGYKPYTTQERERIRELSKIISASEKFKTEARDKWTGLNKSLKEAQDSGNTKQAAKIRSEMEALVDQHSKLFKEAQVANKQMQEFARAPSNIADTLISIIQGNLLNPLSLVTNVYSNAVLQPLRFFSTALGSGLDIATSELAKTGLFGESYKDRTIDMVALNKGYFSGGWTGAIEGVMQLKTGTLADEKSLREIQSSFSPSRAIGRWAESDRTVKQKVNDYIEGTFGLPAEGMFRLLNLGDKPFRRAAEMARAAEIGKLKGLSGEDLLGFVTFPDESSQAEINKAGQEATFQQESKVSKGIQHGIQWFLDMTEQVPYIGSALKVILKSQVPYVKTPLNIAIETVDYAVPPLTLARGIYAYNTGNRRQGNILIGKAIVGGMMIAATRQLFMLGLLEPDEDNKEKTSKLKETNDLRYSTVPPGSINISALARGLALKGFDRKDGDVSVSYKKMGIFGIIMDIHSKDMYSELKEEGKVDNTTGELFLDMFSTAPRVASSTLDQSFLRGTNSFLSAIQDAGGYNTEQWLISTLGSVTSVVIPNTLATISKASDEYLRDAYDKDFTDKLKNAYATKVFLGSKLPPKINLWGEKVTGAPEGRNKYFYYLFDVTKFQQTDTNDVKYKLYKQWKQDNYNSEWLPSMPKRSLKVNGYTIPVEGNDYAELCEYVGKARYSMASSTIRSSADKDVKIDMLKDAYSEGYSLGRERFLLKKGWRSKSPAELEKMSKN